MKIILKFTKLRELNLEAQMYPKGAKFLTGHPSLVAIRGVKSLSYEVAEILANSRLSKQIKSIDFKGTRNNQLAGPIIRQIAKFTNLTHLGIHDCRPRLDDEAMMELAPLVNLRQLYVPFSDITSEGLRALHHTPHISVLSLGYCNIEDGLDHISHLNLTHLDVCSNKRLKTEHLLPILRASPNLVDLNLRYAEGLDAKALAREADLSSLQFINILSVPKGAKAFKGLGAEEYNDDRPFHTLPVYLQDRQ